jgi:WD40 repeat protein
LRRAEPLRGHDREILALSFSPDGKWLATAGYDRIVRLWPVDPPQWVAAPTHLSFNATDVLLNESVPNPEGGVYLARFILGEEWFESYGEASEMRLGRMTNQVRLNKALSPSSEGELNGLDAKEAERLRLRSPFPVLQRRWIEGLHKQASLPDPDSEMIFDFEQDGRALAEAMSDGTIRLWDLQRLPTGFALYQGLSGPITSLCVSTRFGAIAAINKNGQIAIWRIGAPQVPQFVGELARLLESAQPLGTRGDTPAKAAPFDSTGPPPRIVFISGSRWLCVDYKYLIDLASSPPNVWGLPDGAHDIGPVADCCIMQLFPDRFDFWVIGANSDQPTRIHPKIPISDVTGYDYNARLRRLVLGFLGGRVMVMELDADGSVTKSADITSHDFTIRSVALSSDARVVAAGSAGGITMTQLADDLSVLRHIRLRGHRGDVHLLRFSPGDTWLLSGGEDNSVHVYPVSANQVVDLACIVAGRTLSQVEKGRLSQVGVSDVCQRQLKR